MPKTKVFEHNLADVYWTPEHALFEEIYKPATGEATDQDFIDYQNEKLGVAAEYMDTMENYLCDTQLLFFELSPKMQKWCDEVCIGFFDLSTLVKVAFVSSQGLSESIAIEEAMNESPHKFVTRHFGSDAAAKKWLLEGRK